MTKERKIMAHIGKATLLSLSALATLISVAGAQTPPQRDDHPAPSQSTIKECEVGVCGIWIFRGAFGEARWTQGQLATLTYDLTENGNVIIHRRDIAGLSTGLTAVYTGTIVGNKIEHGQVTWTFLDGRTSSAGWTGDIDNVSLDEAEAHAKEALSKHDSFNALRWFLAGAALGNPQMQNYAGIAFSNGYGLPKDLRMAASLLGAAADQGNKEATMNLRELYTSGRTLPGIWGNP